MGQPFSSSVSSPSQISHSQLDSLAKSRSTASKTLSQLGPANDLSSELHLLGDAPVAYGVVSSIWLGEISGNRRVAVKLFGPRSSRKKEFLREAHAWSLASYHENVVPLLGVAQLRGSVALISPWMSDGDLHKYMMGHPDANVLELMADVARGLAYVHSVGIVYGNLRMTTVLVSNMGRAYLSSFLFAHTQDEDGGRRSRSVSGDFAVKFLDWRVISSSVLESDASPVSSLTVESDVFAFGTTMIEAFTVPHPNYKRVMTMRLLQNKLPERPRFIVNNGLTDDLWNLATSCWQEDATLRPMIAEIARKMVQLTEESAPREGTKLSATPRMLNNISAEIRKTSEHPIAGGGYCDLYLGERLGSEKVALKLVRLFGSTDTDRDAARRRFLSEARIWADLKHPRILEFYGICEYGTMSLFMVSPFLSNGNIMHYLSNVAPGANRRRLLLETAQGLHYLHNRRPPVIHGDLKGANILISNTGSAVLADFGLSRISHEATTAMLHGAGSPRWMAPELITAGDEETGPLKTQMTDVYAYGHIMLEVLGGCKPFFNFREDLHVIVELIHGRRSPRPSGPIADTWLDDPVWAYCQTCTAINPDDRPDMETVIADLSVILIS